MKTGHGARIGPKGVKHEFKGAVKEIVGKVTGNKSKKVAGKVQKKIGEAADDIRKVRRD